ncbi:hypothetical protein D3C80_2169480 [compost metagenome]
MKCLLVRFRWFQRLKLAVQQRYTSIVPLTVGKPRRDDFCGAIEKNETDLP